jgi:hypothetical protein
MISQRGFRGMDIQQLQIHCFPQSMSELWLRLISTQKTQITRFSWMSMDFRNWVFPFQDNRCSIDVLNWCWNSERFQYFASMILSSDIGSERNAMCESAEQKKSSLTTRGHRSHIAPDLTHKRRWIDLPDSRKKDSRLNIASGNERHSTYLAHIENAEASIAVTESGRSRVCRPQLPQKRWVEILVRYDGDSTVTEAAWFVDWSEQSGLDALKTRCYSEEKEW